MTEPTVTIPRRLLDELVNLAECAAQVPQSLGWDQTAISATRDTLTEAAQYATHAVYTDQGRVASVDHFGGSAIVDHGNFESVKTSILEMISGVESGVRDLHAHVERQSRVLWESRGRRPGR